MIHTLLALKRVFEKSLCLFLIYTMGIPALLYGQNQTILTNNASLRIKQYSVLPDAKYSIGDVLNNTSLVFKPEALNSNIGEAYWIKLIIYNPYPNDENYLISLSDALNFTLYSYNEHRKTWEGQTAGLNSQQRVPQIGTVPIVLKPQVKNIFYFKVDLNDVKPYGYVKKPSLLLEKEVTFNSEERFLKMFFLICCIALISFACYNLYIYFQLKDKAYLYYVIVQVGALIFFTGDNLYFNVLLPLRIYNLVVLPGGRIEFHDINFFAEHIGVAILFLGFTQFTRSYLGTQELLPFYDKILKWLGYTYFWLEIIPALITISGLYFFSTVIIDNIFILVIIIACIATAVVAGIQKVSVAKHFLLANLLPALCAIAAAVYNLIYMDSNPVLPTMAILSQIFTFAVALVARVKLINADLNAKAEEAMQFKINMTTAAYERMLIEQQNQHMMLTMALEQEQNERLLQQLEANQRELVGNSLQIHQKNKLLSDLKTQFHSMDSSNPLGQPEILRSIKSSLKEGQYLDENWNDFKLHFEQVHPRFFEDLIAAHPGLTTYDLRLYAYFHINLSTKEIASLLNIAPASVRQAKTRLYKKIRCV